MPRYGTAIPRRILRVKFFQNQKAGCPIQRLGNGVKRFWSSLQDMKNEIVSDTYSLDSVSISQYGINAYKQERVPIHVNLTNFLKIGAEPIMLFCIGIVYL